MDTPLLFSIVIPTYNREKFIKKTIASIFEQTYPHYEVIVVDNCSTDRTVEILKPYIDAGKIKFIRHEQNFERARSRNTGMENASGDFLTLLDSDDFMFANNLSDAAGFASDNPRYKVFHNLYSLVDANRKTVYRYKFPSLSNQLKAIVEGNFMSCIGNFLHRDVYKNYRFDTNHDLTGGEDWDFWLRVLADHKLGRIEKYNSGLQHHEGRSVNSQSIESMEQGLRYMVDKFRGDEHLSNVYAAHLKRIEANSYLYLNLLSNDGKLGKKAADYLRKAFSTDKGVFFTTRFQRSLRRTAMNFFT
jgi:glycosyltransferase involved in cell wall biosynthesis